MRVLIAAVAERRGREGLNDLMVEYLTRLRPYAAVEAKTFRSEAALFAAAERLGARTPPVVVLLDSRGKMFTSEEFAAWVGRQRDSGTQNLVFAIGPADGWSSETLESPGLGKVHSASQKATAGRAMLLSLGRITLPHELARVVLAEQLYRAFTILAGHPYHGGH